jgi:hypothetical protein
MMKKSTLVKLYREQRLTIAEIGEEKDIEYADVVAQLKHYDIPIRDPDETDEWDADWLHAQYWEKERTLTAIGNDQGVTPATVLSWMEHFSIPRRRKGARSGTTRWSKDKNNRKLDAVDVALIRQLDANGVKQNVIRSILAEGGKDITKQAISKVVRGETWKDVTNEGGLEAS